MNEQRAPGKSEAPRWTPLTYGVRTLTLQGIVTLRIGDESKTAEAEIVVEQRYPRASSEDLPPLTTWKLRTTVALTDVRADVSVDIRCDGGIHLRSTAFLGAINSSGAEYTGKTPLDGLVEAGLFPPTI